MRCGYQSGAVLAVMGRKGTAAIGRWGMAIIPGIVLLFGGLAKFTATAQWEADFSEWGYPLSLVKVLGVVEIVAAVAILVPRTRFYGAAAIVVIMLGASVTRFMAGEAGPGVFTLAIAGIAAISGWWARPRWFHDLVVREKPVEAPKPGASRRIKK